MKRLFIAALLFATGLSYFSCQRNTQDRVSPGAQTASSPNKTAWGNETRINLTDGNW